MEGCNGLGQHGALLEESAPLESAAAGSAALDTVVRPRCAVSAAAAAVADRAVREGRDIMLFGSHLLPGQMRASLRDRGCNAFVL